MARLLRKNGAGEPEVLELNLGVNYLGRDPENDFRIEHPTISARHCELTLTANGVLLRDIGSTNGTFINDRMVTQAVLEVGQTLRLGDVEFLVDAIDARISIPEIERDIPAPPVVLADGAMLCPRHAHMKVTHRCKQCHSILCDSCVTRMRRKGGKMHKFCKLCSGDVELLADEKRKKKGFFSKLTATIKLPFFRARKD